MQSPSNSRTIWQRLWHRANFVGGVLGPLLALGCVILFFALADQLFSQQPNFLSLRNLQSNCVAMTYIVVAALGMTLIIIAGGIDLSIGSSVGLCAVVIAWGLREDAGFLLTHGTNFQRASAAVQIAEEAQEKAVRSEDDSQANHWKDEGLVRRERLATILERKIAAGDSEKLQAKLAAVRDPAQKIRITPEWINDVPNAAGTAPLAVLMGLISGVLCGLVNGLLIVALRVVPFIVTLATMTIYLGIAQKIAEETAIRPSPAQVPPWIPDLSTINPVPPWILVSQGFWLTVVLGIVLAIVLRFTIFGRYVFAIGSSEATARLCGVNVPLMKIAVYSLAGLFMGVAGLMLFARISSATPGGAAGLELRAIAAVVIGGASLSGGRGSVLGTFAGAAIMSIILSSGTLLGIKNPEQLIVLGVAILAAVWVDQLRRGGES